MKIREIIDILEEYENKSEHGADTEVDFFIHPIVWTANYGYVEAKIEDVMISYGETDRVSFEMSVNEKRN